MKGAAHSSGQWKAGSSGTGGFPAGPEASPAAQLQVATHSASLKDSYVFLSGQGKMEMI